MRSNNIFTLVNIFKGRLFVIKPLIILCARCPLSFFRDMGADFLYSSKVFHKYSFSYLFFL